LEIGLLIYSTRRISLIAFGFQTPAFFQIVLKPDEQKPKGYQNEQAPGDYHRDFYPHGKITEELARKAD
jgi:hypothetical protein